LFSGDAGKPRFPIFVHELLLTKHIWLAQEARPAQGIKPSVNARAAVVEQDGHKASVAVTSVTLTRGTAEIR
jgi:hypothetical protein